MVKTIGREELIQMIDSGNKFKLVDVLAKESYEKEHIRGSISLPLTDIEKGSTRELRKNDLIVTYCAGFECPASTKAAEKLISLGFQNVLDYKGGLQDYKEANLCLEGSLYPKVVEKSSKCCCCD